ncbi:uncharacterized protein LOC126929699 [Macaca thibetana thibetana]|uniref:uncharacterized protein LOC126929699 n=1 Tax=Macaca thibetana thibetana TaxID=257877 RepID=UPI0021BC9DE2|nr:uncharacterized protein LOC126929699 [Macaca thibetana thibetana]
MIAPLDSILGGSETLSLKNWVTSTLHIAGSPRALHRGDPGSDCIGLGTGVLSSPGRFNMQRSLGTTTSEPLHFVWLRLLEALGPGTVAHLPRSVGVRVEPGSVPARARGHRVGVPDPSPRAQSGLPVRRSPSPFPRAFTWGVVGAGDRAGRSREHNPQAGLWATVLRARPPRPWTLKAGSDPRCSADSGVACNPDPGQLRVLQIFTHGPASPGPAAPSVPAGGSRGEESKAQTGEEPTQPLCSSLLEGQSLPTNAEIHTLKTMKHPSVRNQNNQP